MFRIILHGGASETKKSEEKEKEISHALRIIAEIGARGLAKGLSAQEVVELTIFAMESHPLFNAGKIGGFASERGDFNLDASIMSSDLSYATVAGVSIDHPISLVSKLAKGLKHPFRTFYAVDEEANPVQCEETVNEKQISAPKPEKLLNFGTVGAIVIDLKNNMCVGSSTAGLNTNKKPSHRYSDIACLGSGIYCNEKVGITTSGIGEDILPSVPSFHTYALMEYGKLSLQEALDKMVKEIVPQHTIGIIAMTRQGEMAYASNTKFFFVQSFTSETFTPGLTGDIKYPIPEYLFNKKGQCPIRREMDKTEPPNFCPFQDISGNPDAWKLVQKKKF